jgi:hypothetical protein
MFWLRKNGILEKNITGSYNKIKDSCEYKINEKKKPFLE